MVANGSIFHIYERSANGSFSKIQDIFDGGNYITDIYISSDEQYTFAGLSDGSLVVYEKIGIYQKIQTLIIPGIFNYIEGISYDNNSGILVFGGSDKKIAILKIVGNSFVLNQTIILNQATNFLKVKN